VLKVSYIHSNIFQSNIIGWYVEKYSYNF
jgi:hypothetical protein